MNKLAAVLGQTAHSGLYHLPVESQTAAMTACPDFVHCHADLRHARRKTEVLRLLGQALAFPDYYGENFDALLDCLTDPDWRPAPGYILCIAGLDQLNKADASSYATLLAVFRAAAEERRLAGTPFWILLDHAAGELPALPATDG